MRHNVDVMWRHLLAVTLLVGMVGCAGHTASTGVGQQIEGGPLELPNLVVEERVKDEAVVPSAVPPPPEPEGQALPREAASPEPEPEQVVERTVAPPLQAGAAPVPAQPQAARVEPTTPELFLLDIPFNFDQAALRQDALAFVEVNLTRLKEERVGRIVLEGRGDEVGTTEYNLVLGERRAQEVKRYLQNLGLTAADLRVVSFGKENPLCFEHSVDCWQMNRSVRFVVQ